MITQQIIALLPLFIIGLTVVILMLNIAWKRNYLINTIITVIGLSFSFFSLHFLNQNNIININLLQIDGHTIFYTSLILLSSLGTCILAYPYLIHYLDNREEFCLLIAISTIGCLILVSANHLVSLFLGFELSSLPLIGLIGYIYYEKFSIEAAIKYMLLSSVASAFLLFGMALIYSESGNLLIENIGKNLQEHITNQPFILIGLGMMMVGFLFKLSLVPFHLWTPDIYQGAPLPTCAFLSTASKIANFSILMRLFLYMPSDNSKSLYLLLSIISCCSIVFGNLMAMNQRNIKRFLGYSSISHFGYLLVILIALKKNNQFSEEAAAIYCINYLFTNLGVFGVLSLIFSQYEYSRFKLSPSYQGLFFYKPVLSIVMTIMMLSLAGMPTTLGFISKFFILSISINAHLWFLTGIIILGSTVGLYCYLRIIISLYISDSSVISYNNNYQYHCSSSVIVNKILVLICTIVILGLGIFPQPLITLVKIMQPIL